MSVETGPQAPGQLKRNALTGRHVFILAMAATGPASVVALNFGPMGSFAGPAFVLAFVVVLGAILLLANTFVQFSGKFPSAGSLYTWNAKAFGKNFGFLYGWLFGGSYLLLAAAGAVVFGGWASDWILTTFDVSIAWWIFTAAALIYISLFAFGGIAQSTRSALLLLAFELVVIFLLAVWMLIDQGFGAFTAAPFKPSSATGGWAAIGLAMTFGVLSCVGFEEATTVAEETKDSHRAVGRGVLGAAIVIPLFYIFTSYALVVGLGGETISGLAGDSAPLQDAATAFWGSGFGLSIVVVAVLSSILAFTQTGFNAGVRVLYALGREGLLPRGLGRTHRQRKTPHVAIAALAILAALLGVPLAAATHPFDVWAYFGFMISIMFLLVYFSTNLALIRLIRRDFPDEFHVWLHGVFPIVGALAMAYPLYRVVIPVPPSPYWQLALGVLIWLVVGAAVLGILLARDPEAVSRAGLVMGELEVEEEPGLAV